MKRLKIIHIIHSLAPGGAENLVRLLAKIQTKQGHKVELITIGRPVDMARNHYAARFGDDLNAAGIGWRQVTLPKTPRAALAQLRPHLAIEDSMLVHCHIFRGLPALFTMPSDRARVVYTHHNSKYPVPRPLFYGVVNRSADAFVSVCSQTQADATQSFKGPSQVIHNGIDRIQYAERDPQHAPNFPIRLVNIGSLTEQKNHRRALQMMRILGPTYHLTIYGEGPQRQALQELAGDLGLTNVTFKGVSSGLAQELCQYDLMVQTSSWEGMPLSLLEAQAAGLPVVATDVGDTSIIVDDGVTGHLVFPKATPSELAKKVQCAVDPITHHKMSHAAVQHAAQFDVAETARAYDGIYQRLFAT